MGVKYNNCLNCGKPITKGRLDKKFCDSACKDACNNEIKEAERGEINKIELILKRNRRVLKKLYDPKTVEKKVTREMLIREGFEFGFLTHIAVTRTKSNEITFCYDYGYREISKDQFQIYASFSSVQVKNGYRIKIS